MGRVTVGPDRLLLRQTSGFLAVSLTLLLEHGSAGSRPDEPPSVTALRAEAKAALDNGKAEQAVRLLEEGIAEHPSPGLFEDLGNALLAHGQLLDAVVAYQKALRIRPDLSVARYNLSYALRATRRFDEAAVSFEIYLKGHPTDADGWFGLADTLEAKKDPEGAATAYERYAETETRPEQAEWVERARARAAELRARARQSAQPVLSPPPSRLEAPGASSPSPSFAPTPRAARDPGLAGAIEALRGGDFAGALAKLGDAAGRPESADYALWAARGSAYLGLLQGERAEASFVRALEVAPDPAVPGILVGLGEALRLRGRRDEARAMLERALAHPRITADLAEVARARRRAL